MAFFLLSLHKKNINCFHSELLCDPNLCYCFMVTDSWIHHETLLVFFEERVVNLCQLLNSWFSESCGSGTIVPTMLGELIPRESYKVSMIQKCFYLVVFWMIPEIVLRPRGFQSLKYSGKAVNRAYTWKRMVNGKEESWHAALFRYEHPGKFQSWGNKRILVKYKTAWWKCLLENMQEKDENCTHKNARVKTSWFRISTIM